MVSIRLFLLLSNIDFTTNIYVYKFVNRHMLSWSYLGYSPRNFWVIWQLYLSQFEEIPNEFEGFYALICTHQQGVSFSLSLCTVAFFLLWPISVMCLLIMVLSFSWWVVMSIISSCAQVFKKSFYKIACSNSCLFYLRGSPSSSLLLSSPSLFLSSSSSYSSSSSTR